MSLLGGKRTWHDRAVDDANDPKATCVLLCLVRRTIARGYIHVRYAT